MDVVNDATLTDAVAQAWAESTSLLRERVSVLEETALAVLDGQLSVDRRRHAEQEAHKLAGALGSFGLVKSSRQAREAAWLLRAGRDLTTTEALRLSELVVGLRGELAAQLPGTGGPAEAGGVEPKRVLVVDADDAAARRVAEEARSYGLWADTVASTAAARTAISERRPDLVVLDPADPNDPAAGRDLLEDLCLAPDPVPTLVLTRPGGKVDRSDAARLRALGYLEKPVQPTKVVAVVRDLLNRRGPRSTVLVLAEDPTVLAALYRLADSGELRVEELREPARFWHTLPVVRPDMVVLDEDLPVLDTTLLCLTVRSDPAWQRLPLVLVTGRPPHTHRELYRIGADDVITRELVGEELAVRVNNRLARATPVRPAGDTDPGTGLVSWTRFEWDLRRMLGLARRYGHVIAVAVFAVDDVADLEQRHGSQAGAAASGALVRLLQRSFRFEDVVGLRPEQQAVAALYGADLAGTRERIATLLETFRHEQVTVDGAWFEATASAGLAMFPVDGATVEALTDAAGAALRHSVQEGGDRVTTVSNEQPDQASGIVDVLVVDDDDALASLLVHALSTRGYRTYRLADGAEAAAALLDPDGLQARVILLDVGLPGLDGLSVLRQLAHRRILARTRVIMVTLRASEGEALQALELGAFDHVAKPLSVPLLLHRVRQALDSLSS